MSTVDKFVSFLKKRRLWKEYRGEVAKARDLKSDESSIRERLSNVYSSCWQFVAGEFTWSDSRRGHAFWKAVNKEWLNLLNEETRDEE